MPVYATAAGTVKYIGQVAGYGGVILVSLEDQNSTALYGHIRLYDALVKQDNRVKPGQLLAYLGAGFSPETAGERKHLHFALYRVPGIRFRGHEPDASVLNEIWLNPQNFLQERQTVYITEETCVLDATY